jgi:hypothetical protein
MTGVIVTWDQQEIHAIDEGDFETKVVDLVDNFFNSAQSYSEVTVEWKTPTRDHNCVYKVSEPPLTHLDRSRCFIDIIGLQQDGEYKIDMSPSGFTITTKSSGYEEELTYLRLRDDGLAIDTENQEAFWDNMPERVKDIVNVMS